MGYLDASGNEVEYVEIKTQADGANAGQGATTATAYSDSTGSAAGTVIGILKGLFVKLAGTLNVGGNTSSISVTPTISTSAYSTGMGVGGILTLAGALRTSGGTGLNQSCLVIDRSNQKAPFDILLFNQSPSGGTYTDHTTLALAAGDAANIIRRVSITAADYVSISGVAVADLSAISKVVKAVGSANLFALVVTTGSPTYALGALTFNFGFLQD